MKNDSLFAKLEDQSVFKSFALDGWTLAWLDGRVDIAPEYHYEHIGRVNAALLIC